MMFVLYITFFLAVFLGWIYKHKLIIMIGNTNLKLKLSASTQMNLSSVFGNPSSDVDENGLKPDMEASSVAAENPSSDVTENGLKPDLAAGSSLSNVKEENRTLFITDEDLENLHRLVEKTDGGPAWKHVLDCSTNEMFYQAWQRDLETGSVQYSGRTVFENASPEILMDFLWDDQFRMTWDNMLIHAEKLEECQQTGTMVVRWIRSFPVVGKREYIIQRRIWESRGSYYAVTKSVPYLSVPTKDKLPRVDPFYSSVYIQPVESRKGGGQRSACQLVSFHHEDLGVPRRIVNLFLNRTIKGAVQSMEQGLRVYQKQRESGELLSQLKLMPGINTKANLGNDNESMKTVPEETGGVSCQESKEAGELSQENKEAEESGNTESVDLAAKKGNGIDILKLVVIGGAVVVACTLNQGILVKTIICGIARSLPRKT